MAESCHTNPLQQLTSMKAASRSHFMPLEPRNNSLLGTEHSFHQRGCSSLPLIGDHDLGETPSPMHFNMDRQNSIITRNNKTDDILLPQFSAIKINDPLEFSDEYKRFYSKYEQQDITPSVSTKRPNTLKKLQRYSVRKPTICGSRNQDAVGFRDYSIYNDQLSSISNVGNSEQINNNIIDKELESVEQELRSQFIHTSKEEVPQKPEKEALNEKQLEFKKVASNIIETLTPESSRASSPVSSKLSDSKFMDLMRRVCEGEVTLKKDYKGLYTPESNESFGQEYFHVQDETH